MRLVKIDSRDRLVRLIFRRCWEGKLRGEFCTPLVVAINDAADEAEARGVLRSAAAVWRVAAKRTGDRDLVRAARTALDAAECRQVVTAGEDL